MRSLIVAVALCAVMATAAPQDYKRLFGEFKVQYGRTYQSEAEEAKRFESFVENMQKAEKLSALNPKATFGASPYADYTAAEFKRYHNAEHHYVETQKQRGSEVEMTAQEKQLAAGQKINWVDKGAVTHVKNQGDCGSCWSFSTTGGIEGQWFLAGNSLTSLSEQELVSCDTIDDGCQGGIMQNAFKWLMENKDGKIVTAASYPYVSGMGNVPACDCCSTRTFGAQITGHVDVKKTETDMASWLYKNGPLSIAVDATTWQTYTGGIMTDCASTQVDHGVLAVGFDDTNTPPYWIIKNSWGPSWGESGYIRVEKGTDQCLITYDPCSSTVAPAGPTTPAPPAPPTTQSPYTSAPTSAPGSSGTFTQKVCTDSACTEGCQSNSFPQNTCLKLNGGGSATAVCSSSGLTLTEYPLSTDCSGFSIPSSQPVNQCVEDTQGTYLENLCSSSLTAIKGGKVHSLRKQ